MDNAATFNDKFIAYLDILGFKELVRKSEAGIGIGLSEPLETLTALGSPTDPQKLANRGPSVCPRSSYVRRDLDFRATQISDCVVVSAEVSPAGIITLVNHCWVAAMGLIRQGLLCRGYITRGSIYHVDGQMIGTGYQKAYEKERNVAAFKREAGESGTPFVEVDGAVCEYVKQCGDSCVIEMFSRCVKGDGEFVALFPFKRLEHRFLIRGHPHEFDTGRERRANQNVRTLILTLRERVSVASDPANKPAFTKIEHYLRALDAQLDICRKADELFDLLDSPASPATLARLEQFIER